MTSAFVSAERSTPSPSRASVVEHPSESAARNNTRPGTARPHHHVIRTSARQANESPHPTQRAGSMRRAARTLCVNVVVRVLIQGSAELGEGIGVSANSGQSILVHAGTLQLFRCS